MKIAVCVKEAKETSQVDVRFGRAGCFAVYDDQSRQWDFILNSQDMQAAQGAGLQSAQHILDAGADVLLAPNMGPKAMAVIKREQMQVFQVSGAMTAAEAIEKYQAGELEEISQANVEGHWM